MMDIDPISLHRTKNRMNALRVRLAVACEYCYVCARATSWQSHHSNRCCWYERDEMRVIYLYHFFSIFGMGSLYSFSIPGLLLVSSSR